MMLGEIPGSDERGLARHPFLSESTHRYPEGFGRDRCFWILPGNFPLLEWRTPLVRSRYTPRSALATLGALAAEKGRYVLVGGG